MHAFSKLNGENDYYLGNFEYKKAFGQRSLKDSSNHDPMPLDATMWLASCTKLLTSVAAMQLVEQGKIDLDGDVTEILSELKGLEILKGFEKDNEVEKPIFVGNTKVITLKLVLSEAW
jgi:CubicO group peptidase (beta-lactamase class C family)